VEVPEYSAKFEIGKKDEYDKKDEKDESRTNLVSDRHNEKQAIAKSRKAGDEHGEEDKGEDEVFFIDPKNETIDIHDMVVQAIVLQEPIVKRCVKCEKKMEKVSDDDELPEFESK